MSNANSPTATKSSAPKAAPPPPAAPAPKNSNEPRARSPRKTIPVAVAPNISVGEVSCPQKIAVYGSAGIGKTTLAAYLPAPLFLDLDHGSHSLPVARDNSIDDWLGLRGVLASIAMNPPSGVKTIVVDTATAAEELAKEHIIDTRKVEGGDYTDTIEGFGWGKGFQYTYEAFRGLLADFDRIVAAGMNVCLIAHEVDSPVPNPAGEDYIRWEPHLYSGDKKGRGSIRAAVKQWADHLLFVGYDVHVKKGKGAGSGTRTVYTSEMPTHIAKSRTFQGAIDFERSNPAAVWQKLNIPPAPQ